MGPTAHSCTPQMTWSHKGNHEGQGSNIHKWGVSESSSLALLHSCKCEQSVPRVFAVPFIGVSSPTIYRGPYQDWCLSVPLDSMRPHSEGAASFATSQGTHTTTGEFRWNNSRPYELGQRLTMPPLHNLFRSLFWSHVNKHTLFNKPYWTLPTTIGNFFNYTSLTGKILMIKIHRKTELLAAQGPPLH